MKAYPKYKPSGIDWLGEVPNHWKKLRFKYFLDQITSPSTAKRKVALENIESQTGYYIETNSEFEGDGVGFILGDIVYGKLRPYLKKVWLAAFDGNAIGDFFVYRVKKNADNNYIKWLFLTEDFTSIVNQSTYGAKMPRVSSDFIKDLDFYLPPIDEQEAIAAYLNDVTGKVDALIAEKQKQVEDLRSYRTSLITETVTRGLNPDAPLRPSGIDWLGDLPEHWISTKAKYYIEIKSGDPISKDDINSKGSVPIFGGGEIIGYTTESNIPAQTIIIGRVGARCGCVRLTDIEAWATDNALVVLTSQDPRFLTRIFEAANLNRLNESNAQPLITATKIKDLGIPLPPLVEQQAIAEFLDKKTKKIDALISELEKQLEELAEYRKAVISEAVTGKVDVRDWKPQN